MIAGELTETRHGDVFSCILLGKFKMTFSLGTYVVDVR